MAKEKTNGAPTTRERIMRYIRDFVDEHGYAPTIREILRGLGISSTSVVQYHLNVLERDGQIHRDPDIFRSIQLVDRRRPMPIPLLGSIAAGEPLPVLNSDSWINEAQDVLEVPGYLTKGRQVYALKVRGLSMVEALIDDGDIVLLEPASTAEDGETVAVRLKDEQGVTLKKFYRESKRVRLQPANRLLPAIYSTPDNIEVQGRVVGVIRPL